jgi:TatD DNase family protein
MILFRSNSQLSRLVPLVSATTILSFTAVLHLASSRILSLISITITKTFKNLSKQRSLRKTASSAMMSGSGFSLKGMPSVGHSGGRFFEIGANLLDDTFRGIYHGKQKHQEDILNVLERGKEMGVQRQIVTAGCLEDSVEALKLVRLLKPKYELFSTVGVHPTRANELRNPEEAAKIIDQLKAIIADGRSDGSVLALGECGLDYDRLQFCTKEVQLSAFKLQLNLAAEVSLPMFLHNRNTNGDFIRIVTEERAKMKCGGVVHSFDGTLDEMLQLVELGLYIGINGCSLRTEENLAVVAQIPENRLLLETDSPWCGVKPTHAGSKHLKTDFPRKKAEKYEAGFMVKDRNEPCTIVQVLEIVAAVRGADPLVLAEKVYSNSEALFFPSTIHS